MHPHAAEVSAASQLWIFEQAIDTIYNPTTLQVLLNSRAGMMPPRIHVNAGDEELGWICKYWTWFFALDDQLDEAENLFSSEKKASILFDLNLILLCSFPDDHTLRSNLGQFVELASPERQNATWKYVEAKLNEARRFPGTGELISAPSL